MRGNSKHDWLVRTLGILLWLAPTLATADEFHDGEDGGGNDLAVEEEAAPQGSAPSGAASPFIEERAANSAAKLRDASGKLTAPPNFRIASVVFEDRVNPKPTPVPLKTIAPVVEPKVAIETIPTYSGGAPSASTGFIGAELTADEAKKEPTKPSFQNGRRASDTAGRIRSAIDGAVQSETEQQAKEALREKMRVPAAIGP